MRSDYCLIRIGLAPILWERYGAWKRWRDAANDPVPLQEYLEQCRRDLWLWLKPFLQGREPLDEWSWECESVPEELMEAVWRDASTGLGERLGIQRFDRYLEEDWIRRWYRQEENRHTHLLILGTATCLPDLLIPKLHLRKSIYWVLTEGDCQEMERELMEVLDAEYGLPVKLALTQSYRTSRLQTTQAADIWDFTQETRLCVADLPKGSFWYDFTSNEHKEERIRNRNPGLSCFSMKKQWREP